MIQHSFTSLQVHDEKSTDYLFSISITTIPGDEVSLQPTSNDLIVYQC